MYTYFIRHTEDLGVIDEALETFWKENKVGIHFPDVSDDTPPGVLDSSSINPDDYSDSSDKKAIKCFSEINNEGGYIWAEYRNRNDIKIGKIFPNTFQIMETKWLPDEFPYERTALLKTLQMENVKILKPKNALFLKACRPRQGTMCRWHLAKDKLDALVEGRPIKKKIDNLTPSQQETVCAEYLSNINNEKVPKLVHLLLPVGRTLKDIDIYGYNRNEKRIFCQVTNYSLDNDAIREKIDSLLEYRAPDTELVLFCPHDRVEKKDGYTIIPLLDVEKWMLNDTVFTKHLFNL